MNYTILYVACVFKINTVLNMENNNDIELQMKSDKSISKKFSNIGKLVINNPMGFVARTSLGGGIGYGVSKLALKNITEDSHKLLQNIKKH